MPLFSDPNQELQHVVAKVKENAHVWDRAGRPISPGSFPDIQPETPANVTATGLFSAVMVEWDFNHVNTYIAGYEVYASEVEGFAGTPETLVFRGSANGYSFQGEPNKQYYFRVRAFNYHEKYSAFSEEISATTARIVSDDILFGEDIANELRRLSERAQIIADGSLGIDQIKQEVFDQVERDTRRYTDQEIQHVENHINQELADKAGFNYVDGKFTDAIEVINGVEGDIRKDLADKAGLSYVDGKFEATDDQINAINDGISTINTDLEIVDTGLSLRIEGVEGDLDKKLDTGVYTERMTSIDASIQGINTKVSDHTTDINTVTGEVSGVKSRTSTLEQRADAFSVNLTSLETSFGNMEIGVQNLLTGTSDAFQTYDQTSTWGDWTHNSSARNISIQEGETYTARIYLKPSASNTKRVRIMVRTHGESGESVRNDFFGNYISPGQEGYSTITFTVPPNRVLMSVHAIRFDSSTSSRSIVEYKELKLEKGTKATGWQPATREIKSEIEGLKERTTKTETDLSVLPGLISAKASQGQVDRIESNSLM
ncbi:hypothetical protein [Bacillus sp. JCM 19041]|uniref:hypothetical protein n=1 Tax=Bacillus sp. JCM 19041 TaxID=1460637 RepID=UPI0006D17F8A